MHLFSSPVHHLIGALSIGLVLLSLSVECHVPHARPVAASVPSNSKRDTFRTSDPRRLPRHESASNSSRSEQPSSTTTEQTITRRVNKNFPPPIQLTLNTRPANNYLGQMRLTPAAGRRTSSVSFDVAFDTTVSRVMVPSKRSRGDVTQAPANVKYDEPGTPLATDITYSPELFNDGGSRYTGDVYEESVNVGEWNVYTTGDLNILSVTNAESSTFTQSVQAFVGLAPFDPGEGPDSKATSFIAQLTRPDKCENWHGSGSCSQLAQIGLKNEFSFYFERESAGDQVGSQLTIGYRDDDLYTGPVTTMSVERQEDADHAYWQLPVSAVIINGESHPLETSTQAIFASAYNHIMVPMELMDKLDASIPDAMDTVENHGDPRDNIFPGEVLTVPCDSTPRIAFELDGQGPFELDPADIINQGWWPEQPGSTCTTKIFSHGNEDDKRVILGIPFLKSWYSTYQFDPDGNKISLANAKHSGQPGFVGASGRQAGTVATS